MTRMRQLITRTAVHFFAALCCYTLTANAADSGITVFAATSCTNALTEITRLFEANEHEKVTLAFDSSSTLAKQIENGAPADIFLSANASWMEYLAQKKLLHSGSRFDLLGNKIVLIVPKASAVQHVEVNAQLNLAALLGKDGLLALGDPAHVPVGMYAKTALQNMHLWTTVEKRLAPAKDVRAGLVLVERGEVPLGIVYASDAVISDKVRVVGTFPRSSHPKVDYPIALLAHANQAVAQKFMRFLTTPQAKIIWSKYGFEVH